MRRELPMFEPPGAGGHGHEPLTIAIGGGRFEAAADGSTAPRRHPDWIRARLPDRPELPGTQEPHARPHAQHRVRGGALPEHRRVLGAAHRHGHDPGRHLHPGLRLLRGQDRPAHWDDDGRAAPRRGGGQPDGPGARGRDQRRARRPARRRRRTSSRRPSARSGASARAWASRSSSPTSTARTSRCGRSWRPARTSSTTTSRPSSGSRSRSASAPATTARCEVLRGAKAMALRDRRADRARSTPSRA